MNIVLENVKITCVRCDNDTLLITCNNVSMGIWPFNGNQTFKTEVPRGHAEEWLIKNFGSDIIKSLKVISDE